MENGALGWTRTNNFRVRNAALFPLSYESNQTRGTNGICTHTAAFTEPNANYYTMAPVLASGGVLLLPEKPWPARA